MRRAIWLAAPLALLRHSGVLLAVFASASFVGVAASSSAFLHEAVATESLKGQLLEMTPLAAGLEIRSGGRPSNDQARRAAAISFGRTVHFLGTPILTSKVDADLHPGEGAVIPVVLMARTDAIDHVRHLTAKSRYRGVWISQAVAETAGLRPGAFVRLGGQQILGLPSRSLEVRVAGIYASLDGDLGNPYWANFIQDIRPPSPDLPMPPSFVLTDEATLLHVAGELPVDNRFEYPVTSQVITVGQARSLEHRFASVEQSLHVASSPLAQKLGCAHPGCPATSSIDAAIESATSDVAAVSPVISLISAYGIAIALALAFAAGAFLISRRSGEAAFLHARGESALTFGLRTATESFFPSIFGGAVGFLIALAALAIFAPSGALDASTLRRGAAAVIAGSIANLVAVGAGAAFLYPRERPARGRATTRRVRRWPWEIVPLAVAFLLFVDIVEHGGLSSGKIGHPQIAVFLLPTLIAAGVAGLFVRAGRGGLRRIRATDHPTVPFLVVRRLAAARGLLVAVTVFAAIAFAAFAYATILVSSLNRSAAEKAFIANGSDVQGVVDPAAQLTKHFAFPAVVIEQDLSGDVTTERGQAIDLMAADPAKATAVIDWGSGWPDDPRSAVASLARLPASNALEAIATPNAPNVTSLTVQNTRVPIKIIGRAELPGALPGHAALFVSSIALRRTARRLGFLEPNPAATGIIWAKGDPSVIEPALTASDLSPTFLTTTDYYRNNKAVVATRRTYTYYRLIGIAAAVLSLFALLLYLHARHREQVVASALVRRMGFQLRADSGAVALEAVVLALAFAAVGLATALLAARLLISHVDPLPQFAPSSQLVIPWTSLLFAAGAEILISGLLGLAATVAARRRDIGMVLRVA